MIRQTIIYYHLNALLLLDCICFVALDYWPAFGFVELIICYRTGCMCLIIVMGHQSVVHLQLWSVGSKISICVYDLEHLYHATYSFSKFSPFLLAGRVFHASQVISVFLFAFDILFLYLQQVCMKCSWCLWAFRVFGCPSPVLSSSILVVMIPPTMPVPAKFYITWMALCKFPWSHASS